MGGTHFLLCWLGLAVTVRAQDCSRPVAGPNMNIKGADILLETFKDGATVSFACDSGYQTAGGSPVVTCTAGRWSSLRLRCIRKNCGSAGEVTYGQVDYPEGTEFGDKAVITCDTGYTLVGKNSRICQDQGWSGRLPSCEVIICDPPPVMVNGSFSPNKDEYEYRDVVGYRCEKDYTLIGPKSTTCSEDGTFKPDPPKCELIWCERPTVDNADWTRRPPYRPSSTLTFQCRPGYGMIGKHTQTCGINGKWSPGLPTCEPKNCSRPVPGPNIHLNGINNTVQTFSHGTMVSLACDVGYLSVEGSDIITCNAGSWTTLMMKCQRKNCGAAGKVTHGRVVHPEGTQFGDKAVITCDTGYKLVGKNEIICEDQGWSGGLPTCEVLTCDPPPVIVNGSFSPNNDEYKYRDFVVYRCEKDYSLTGSISITCSEDGTFKPDPPTCELIQCEHPAVENADWTRRPPYRPSSTLTFQCRPGYGMIGERTQTCDRNGKWSPGLPTCELTLCEEPYVTNVDMVVGSQDSYRPMSTVTFQCSSGYTMKGESNQMCDVNGKWSPGLPTCEYTRNDWPLVLCFFGGLGSGVVLTQLATSLMKKKKGLSRKCNKDERVENGELQILQ